jgi:hypothetical protein
VGSDLSDKSCKTGLKTGLTECDDRTACTHAVLERFLFLLHSLRLLGLTWVCCFP